MTTILRGATACAMLALAAGCGGGGSSPGNAPQAATSAPGSGAPASFAKSDATVTLRISSRTSAKRAAHGRKRLYVSPATQGLIATFAGASTTTSQGFTLAPDVSATTASPATCGAITNTSYSCTLHFDLPPASYTATLTTYDSAQSGTSGTPVASSGESAPVALSSDTEPVTVAANTANAFAFTLHAIVDAFQSTPQYIGVPAAPASPAPSLSTTFSALDGDGYLVDSVDPDSTTTFFSGMQPSGPFSAISFAVSEIDGNTCNASPCTTLASSSPTAVSDTATEAVSFSYTGQGVSGDGTASNPPYYGLIALADPAGYDGTTSAASPPSGPYAATAFVVPFFGFVNTSLGDAAAVDAADVAFTSSTQSVTLDAVQYHLPDASTGYTATLDGCTAGSGAAIATVSAPTALAYGASFVLTAGSASGSCTVVLSDGLPADDVTIDVTNTAAGATGVTVPSPCPTLTPDAKHPRHRSDSGPCTPIPSYVPPQLVQYNTGIGTVSLPNPVTAGDTLVLTISNFEQSTSEFPTTYGNFTEFPAAEDAFTTFYLQDVTTSGTLTPFALGGPTDLGGTTYWIGEFSGSSSAAIASVNSAINGQGGPSVTIVPNAPEGLLLVSSEGGENASLSGYQQFTVDSPAFTEGSGGGSELQVELATSPTTDTTDSVTVLFAGPYADSESAIQIAPAAFTGTQGALRRRAIDPAVLRRHLVRLRMR
jgi:hypothetical protein